MRRELARDRLLELAHRARRSRRGRGRGTSCAATRADPSRPSRTCRSRGRERSARARTRTCASGCSWTMLAGHDGSKRSSASIRAAAVALVRARAGRAAAPRASAIVPSPTETPCVGTSSSDANSGNVARLSRRVVSASSHDARAAVARRARAAGTRRGRPTRPTRAGTGRCRRRSRCARRRRPGRRDPAATRARPGCRAAPRSRAREAAAAVVGVGGGTGTYSSIITTSCPSRSASDSPSAR